MKDSHIQIAKEKDLCGVSTMKFYAVAKGRKPGIYLTWEECKKQTTHFCGAKFKSFDSVEDAEKYYASHNKGTLPTQKNYADAKFQEKKTADVKCKYVDNCLVCGRPFKQQRGKNNTRKATVLCRSCKGRQSSIRSSVKHVTNGEIGWVSANDLVYIKQNFRCSDPFDYMLAHPESIFDAKKNADAGLVHRQLKKNRENIINFADCAVTPLYIKTLLGDDRELVKIEGDPRDPRITFRCKRCEDDFTMRYKTLAKHKGHNCTALISTGESIVKNYLMELGVQYLTQWATLKCINPETGHVMPYDFELPQSKIIIEVQGAQHRSFIELFHADMDGFEYQKWKDAYKKQFAMRAGYTVLEIWYSDIELGRYKKIISAAIAKNTQT